MAHYIFRCDDGSYVSTRKSTGRGYECRTSTSTLEHCRVFNTAGAARNAANQAGVSGEVLEVGLDHRKDVCNETL